MRHKGFLLLEALISVAISACILSIFIFAYSWIISLEHEAARCMRSLDALLNAIEEVRYAKRVVPYLLTSPDCDIVVTPHVTHNPRYFRIDAVAQVHDRKKTKLALDTGMVV